MSTAIYDHRETIGEEQSPNPVPASKEVNGTKPSKLQALLFSFSLANLCFLMVWQTAIGLASNEAMKYFEMAPPSFGFVTALLLDIGILSCVVYFFLWVRSRSGLLGKLSSAGLVAICAFALLELEQLAGQQLSPDGWGPLILNVLAIAAAFVAVLSARRAKRFVKGVILVLSPLLPLLTLDAAWLYSRPELQHLRTDHVAGKLASVANRNRVIWIIFDEMDYHLAFEARPPRLKMPEFDRLQDISFIADHARSPASQTILSIPSLLTGRLVVEERAHTNDLALRFDGSSDWRSFSSQPNIFRKLREAGLNTAVAGWHHSYCRVIGNDLSECETAPNGDDSIAFYDAVAPWPFLKRSLAIAIWQIESLPLERLVFCRSWSFWASQAGRPNRPAKPRIESALFLKLNSLANIRNRTVREQQVSAARFITANAVRMAQDPDLNLILVHAPAPHPPGIWNSQTQQFAAIGRSDYIDNLGFTDSALGQIRHALEKTGDWDRTTLLISADHPFRTKIWEQSSLWTPELAQLTNGRQWNYVPFIVKLPNQTEPFRYHPEFNTVVSGDLIWGILNGGVKQPEQVARWLDMH